jgi:hypothetical protein
MRIVSAVTFSICRVTVFGYIPQTLTPLGIVIVLDRVYTPGRSQMVVPGATVDDDTATSTLEKMGPVDVPLTGST